MAWFRDADPLLQALAAGGFTWLLTAAGAGTVYALAFAAGAMIFVVIEELIPEAQQGGHTDLATGATMAGFSVMMVLDVALG